MDTVIILVYNCDTRRGCDSDTTTVGDFASGSLEGCRSYDFIVEGLRNKLTFFSGHPIKAIVCIDEHEPLPESIHMEMNRLCESGALWDWECSPKDRTAYRWYDRIYIKALKMVPPEATYIVHCDQDNAMFRDPNSNIVHQYINWLDSGWDYVCQPHNGGDPMWWASTRFFMCKRETLDIEEAERCLDDSYRRDVGRTRWSPCLEHILGDGKQVLYPEPTPEEYMVINWSRYHKGLYKKLAGMPYPEIRKYIEDCGCLGANDVIAKPI